MRHLPALFALALIAAQPAAHAATPRSETIVAGASVTIGDVFDDAGTAASRLVLAAPEAGRSIVLDTATLSRLAANNGLNWHPVTGSEMTRVTRASETFAADVIADTALSELALEAPAAGHLSLQLDNPQLVLHAPVGSNASLSFSSLGLDNSRQRVTGMVQLKAGDKLLAQAPLAGRIVSMADIPVVTRPMRRDEVIRVQDIRWQSINLATTGSGLSVDAQDLIGKSPRTALRPGVPVRMADLLTPPVVIRGSQVTLLYEVGTLTITAQGRALADAAIGESVRVVNTTSSRTIEGVAQSSGVVRVGPAPQSAARADASADLAPAPDNLMFTN